MTSIRPALRSGPATGRRVRIGCCLDSVLGDYQTPMRRAMERACAERDLDLLTFVGGPYESPIPKLSARNRLYGLIGPERLDGAIVISGCVGSQCPPERLRQLFELFKPLPACSLSAPVDGVPSVLVDNQGGMAMVIEHLIVEHGRRRVAFVRGPRTSGEAENRFRAYRDTLTRNGLLYDPQLVAAGDFEARAGAAAIATLLDERGVRFDALVAANDNMAAGAVDALLARNVRVPQDVAVAGFDDASIASLAATPLSTARQPFLMLARSGVDAILAQLAGRAVDPCRLLSVELVTRQSCGCGAERGLPERRLDSARAHDASGLARSRREQLERLVERELQGASSFRPELAAQLLDALEAELAGRHGALVSSIEAVLERARDDDGLSTRFQHLIAAFRAELHGASTQATGDQFDAVWQAAYVAIGEARVRAESVRQVQLVAASSALQASAEALSTCLDYEGLSARLAELLPKLGIHSAYISQFTEEPSGGLLSRLSLRDGQLVGTAERPLRVMELAPDCAFDTAERHSYVVIPLSVNDAVVGLALFFVADVSPLVYENLRDQIGGALHVIALHIRVLAAVAGRERAERSRRSRELEIAASIRADLRPKQLDVHGLDIGVCAGNESAARTPYVDLIATGAHSWLALGQVSGGGLATSLVLLMLRSAIAALVHAHPAASPAELKRFAEAALSENLARLRGQQQAEFGLLRLERDGSLHVSPGIATLVLRRAGRAPVLLPERGALRLELVPGDLLFACAAPLAELSDARGVALDRERLLAALERTQEAHDGSSQAMAESLRRELRARVALELEELPLLVVRVQTRGTHSSRAAP